MSFTSRRIGETDNRRQWFPMVMSALLVVAKFGKPVGAWYKSWKARRDSEERERTYVRFFKKAGVVTVSILAALLILGGTFKTLLAMRVITLGGIFSAAGTQLPKDENGYTNFLLLGKGDESHDGVDLTDTIMIASVDPRRTQSVVLMSVPRDLYFIKTDEMGTGRINELYRNYKHSEKRQGLSTDIASQQAMKELAKEVGKAFGIQIHEVAMVDFIAFVQAVDALGGIDIVVPEDLIDTEYPTANYGYETFAIKAGPQHLDGETALKYARSRHSTSDFDRSARQQQILSALADKARSGGVMTSPTKLNKLWKIISEHSETTMSFQELLSAAGMGDAVRKDRILSVQLNNQYGYDGNYSSPGGFLYNPPREDFDGASVLLPISFPASPITFKQVQTFTKLVFQNRAIYLADPQIAILNAGAKSGMGRKLAGELIRHNFSVDTIDNAEGGLKRETSAIIVKNPDDKSLGTFFSTLLQIPFEEGTGGLPPESLGRVTILLGKDYEFQLFQNLLP